MLKPTSFGVSNSFNRVIACSSSPPATPPSSTNKKFESGEQVIRQFWDLTLQCKYADLVDLFTDDAVYNDLQYPQPKRGKTNILKFMQRMEAFLSADIIFVIDQLVADNKSAAVRWHLEKPNGQFIAFTRGTSFYSLSETEDKGFLISEVWDFTEPPLKLGDLVAKALPFLAKIL